MSAFGITWYESTIQWQIHTQKFPAHAPLWDQILLFSHTFSLKSAHVGGPRPPPTGNPGSVTAIDNNVTQMHHKFKRCKSELTLKLRRSWLSSLRCRNSLLYSNSPLRTRTSVSSTTPCAQKENKSYW